MFGLDADSWAKIACALYTLLGVPIAWIFIKHEKMTTSVHQAPPRASALVALTLALMWPILLFCMALNRCQEKARKGSLKADSATNPVDKPKTQIPRCNTEGPVEP